MESPRTHGVVPTVDMAQQRYQVFATDITDDSPLKAAVHGRAPPYLGAGTTLGEVRDVLVLTCPKYWHVYDQTTQTSFGGTAHRSGRGLENRTQVDVLLQRTDLWPPVSAASKPTNEVPGASTGAGATT